MKFKNLPITYRSGSVLDTIENIRLYTQPEFGWMDVLLSNNLYEKLELELSPHTIYEYDWIIVNSCKIRALADRKNELPPNSIINIEND